MRKRVVLYVLLFDLVLLGLKIIVNFNTHVLLVGDKNVVVKVNNSYKDLGVKVVLGNKNINKNNYKVNISDNIDINKVGEYEVDYEVDYLDKKYHLYRVIEIIDDIKPKIDISVSEIVKDYCSDEVITNYTINAIDNYDGDITNRIGFTDTHNKRIFKVSDLNGNLEVLEIPILFNEKKDNRFILNGDSTIYVKLNSSYIERGAVYLDGCGNKIDTNIKIDGEVDTSKIGEYSISYQLDNGKSLKRKVIVYEEKYNPKNIYLTFDDGPGYYTTSILNTLAKYNVKATFFVTNQFPSYEYLIGEEVKQGHKVAIHTFSHNYNIYSSLDSYLEDFNQMNEIVKNYLGEYSKLFRFPGGSSNTVSRNYKQGVVSEIASYMTEQGYVYFDWNVSSTDASGSGTDKIIQKTISGVSGCTNCVILMHDIKKTTANALDEVLRVFKNRGYSFYTLDENSPTVHHRIAN